MSSEPVDPILAKIDRYYSGRLEEHGPTPRGVDWNSAEAQEIRFHQLFKLIDVAAPSILDFGCGYGAFADYVHERAPNAHVVGYDVSSAMIAAACRTHSENAFSHFTSDRAGLPVCDYVVASGIFSVKMDVATEVWEQYIEETIAQLFSLARRGVAFNLLTAYSDPERMRPDLYYGDPHRYFDLCRTYSRNVALLHDYGLYEFTLHVRL